MIILFIDKVAIGTKSLVLIIMKFAPAILLLAPNNTPSFVHNKSSSPSQIIKGKYSDLQKLLKIYLQYLGSYFYVQRWYW